MCIHSPLKKLFIKKKKAFEKAEEIQSKHIKKMSPSRWKKSVRIMDGFIWGGFLFVFSYVNNPSTPRRCTQKRVSDMFSDTFLTARTAEHFSIIKAKLKQKLGKLKKKKKKLPPKKRWFHSVCLKIIIRRCVTWLPPESQNHTPFFMIVHPFSKWLCFFSSFYFV